VLAAHVAADQLDLLAGQVQPVALVVGQHQVVALGPADAAVLHADIAADAVDGVDHDVARLELLQGELAAGVPGPAAGRGQPGLLAGLAAGAVQVALGDQGQAQRGQPEAGEQRRRPDQDPRARVGRGTGPGPGRQP
jgi:hypothetical protein